LGRITIKAKTAPRALKEAKVKNTLYLEDFIKSETTGGPKATPMKRMLLYMDVIVPRCFFSMPSVIIASKDGKRYSNSQTSDDQNGNHDVNAREPADA